MRHDGFKESLPPAVRCFCVHLPLVRVPSPGYNGLEKGIFHKSSEIRLFLYEDSFNQKKLVEALHISPTALSKRLKLSGIKTYLCCRRALHWLPRKVMHG